MARLCAWRILRSGRTAPLRRVDRFAARAGLDARDRALVRRLVGTEIRRRGTLRALVRHFADRPPNADLLMHLHLGLAQIFFLDRVPDHAAVNETSRAVHATSGPSKVRVVNAILRAALRARRPGTCGDPRRDLVGRDLHLAEPVFRDPGEHPFLWAEDALSMPAAAVKRWTRRYGSERARSLCVGALEEAPLAVRAVCCERDALRAELAAAGIDAADGAHPSALRLDSSAVAALSASEPFRAGRATVQGETALRAAELVQAVEGERVLELGAAPGGKTAVLAAAGAHVLAVDAGPGRLPRLLETVTRLGVAGRVQPLCADGAQALAGETFDAALVDAPCTNTGVLAQRPEARWRLGPANRRSLTELQARLLAEAAERVRPGGRLVYATCSIEPEENAHLVRAFLGLHPQWTLDCEEETLPDPRGGGPVDGGYAARLRRAGRP